MELLHNCAISWELLQQKLYLSERRLGRASKGSLSLRFSSCSFQESVLSRLACLSVCLSVCILATKLVQPRLPTTEQHQAGNFDDHRQCACFVEFLCKRCTQHRGGAACQILLYLIELLSRKKAWQQTHLSCAGPTCALLASFSGVVVAAGDSGRNWKPVCSLPIAAGYQCCAK